MNAPTVVILGSSGRCGRMKAVVIRAMRLALANLGSGSRSAPLAAALEGAARQVARAPSP